MSFPLKIEVTESIKTLRNMMSKSIPSIRVRLNMLILIKKNTGSISRRKLAVMLGVSDKSIDFWRKKYLEGGIESLISHDRKGRKSKIFGEAEYEFLRLTLSDPENGIQGYTELLKIVNEKFGKEIKYITFVHYCERNFGTKIKVARKSHVNKNKEAVETFKKTFLVTSRLP